MIQLKVLCLSLGLALQATAMMTYSNSIIFFNLILVLLILCNEFEGPTIISEISFAGDGNSEQFLFDCIF